MRLLASCLLLLVVGCSKPDHAREHREAAAYIEKELAPATIEPRIAYFTKSPDKEITARTFQMLRARATCNGDVIEVAYNPYGDQLHIGLGTSRAVTLHLLNLELAGRSVWTNPEKLDRRKNVLDFETAPGAAIPVHQVMLDKITTTHAENFPSDQSVTVSATGKSTIARRVGTSKFEYVTHEHLVWRIKLHVFSPEMAKQLEDHRKALYAAHAKLFAVAQFRDRIERLRSNDDAALQRVVKRFDEIAVPAKLEADRLATIPFANLSSSLSVEPATPCVVAPMR